jgi:hypothetical protein
LVKETVKKRITKKDWHSVEQFIQDELKTREASKQRKSHSSIWREVDRQVAMESMSRNPQDKNADTNWRNAIELGELSRASEVITADVRRLTFPTTRSWFDPHAEIPPEQDEAGNLVINTDIQTRMDGRQRAFMTQQHLDFGFKSRVDLSVKEALHHGSYVSTIEWETAIPVIGGSQVSSIAAPVWRPHSMWNCYPDPSIGGTNTFYQGSMIIKTFKPAYQVRRMKSASPDYPFFNLNKIEKRTNRREQAEDTDDIELITYYGDLVIPRAGGDILLLNSRAILANGKIIHYEPNPFPYPPVIYNGWERLDVRDPYYVSPLVKFSVDQKIGSLLANRLLDMADLKAEPPVIYDGNDPDFMLNGGPDISPGAKTSTKGTANYTVLNDIGDMPSVLSSLQFVIQQIEAGTKVDRVRSGVSPGTEQTATEVIKQSQNSELSTIDFVDKHETHGLRPALYIMDFLNRNNIDAYKFYNQELDAPDFEVMKRSELPSNVQYDIVGSKGLLGEEQRQSQTSQVTSFWMGANPQLLKQPELAKEMFRDAGNKNPEKFLNVGDEADAMQQQFQQVIQQLQEQAQQAQQEMAQSLEDLTRKLDGAEFKNEQLALDKDQKDIEKAGKDVRIQSLTEQIRLIKAEQALEDAIEADEDEGLKEAIDELLTLVGQPKKIVFDGNGRPVGVEAVQGGEKVSSNGDVKGAIDSLVKQVKQPKKIIFDNAGSPIGVETVQ